MKTIKNILAGCILLACISSCQKDPLKDVNSGKWNKEKCLIGLSFASQAGDAQIDINIDNTDKGTAEVTVVNPDMTKGLKIEKMEISYGATASVKVGDELSFNPETNSAVITVTSANGDVREYTVTVNPLSEILIGTWAIKGMDIFGGTGPYYGGSDFVNLAFDPSWWDSKKGVNAALDNTLTFTFEGVNESGQTYGKCVHDAGADNLFADFTWAAGFPDGGWADGLTDETKRNANVNFDKIPHGESQWTHDYGSNTVTFTQDGKSFTAAFVNSGNITYWGRNLQIDNNALKFSGLKSLGGWGPIYTAYDKVVYAPWDFYVQIQKQ